MVLLVKVKNNLMKKKIINVNKETFEIEEYEVFQIIDDRFSSKISQFMFKKTFQFIKWMFKGDLKVILEIFYILCQVICFLFISYSFSFLCFHSYTPFLRSF